MTVIVTRMAYLGDGISTDDGGFDEEVEEEGAPYVPPPIEEAKEGDETSQGPDEE